MTTYRQRTRRLPPIALAMFVAPLAMVFGVWGYRGAFPGLSATDLVYRSLQLFAVDAQLPEKGTPWQLDVARFAAPLAVVYAAVLAAIALLRNRYDAWRVRFGAAGHVVVVGLGDTGVRVVRGLRSGAAPARVVVVELDPRNPYIPTARSQGARVVTGDATSPLMLERVRVKRARHVVVLTGDDSLNLEIAAGVRQRARGADARVSVHVALDHLDLWRELSRVRLLAEDSVDVEYVHLPDRAALRLVDEMAGGGDLAPRRVLVEGDDPLAARAATHLVRRSLADGREPMVAVGSELEERLRDEEPWMLHHVDRGDGDAALDVVLVCSSRDGDAAGIARGLQLAHLHRSADVLVTVHHEGSGERMDLYGSRDRKVRLVPPRVDQLGEELFERSAIELMAKARHAGYVADEVARGVNYQENPSIKPWAELEEPLKVSNRRYAESIATILGSLEAELVPLAGPPPPVESCLSKNQIERLAELEHERWVRDLRAEGWRPTRKETDQKDLVNKLHPLLKDWEWLKEPDREKDRQSVRDLPAMLARLGYELVLPGQAS